MEIVVNIEGGIIISMKIKKLIELLSKYDGEQTIYVSPCEGKLCEVDSVDDFYDNVTINMSNIRVKLI